MAMEEQKEKEKIFCQLISQLIAAATDSFSIDEVKDFFQKEINSARSLERASSLREVFHLLAKRDTLNWYNVTPLMSLGELLNNEKIKELVHCYKKTCLDEEEEACRICGLYVVQSPTSIPFNEHNGNQIVLNTMSSTTLDSLDVALENVALNIGANWCLLVRELGSLREIQIEKCYEAHPNDRIAQARMALKLWRQNEKENASIEKLDKTLESRLCKLKGIGLHLKDSILGVNC